MPSPNPPIAIATWRADGDEVVTHRIELRDDGSLVLIAEGKERRLVIVEDAQPKDPEASE